MRCCIAIVCAAMLAGCATQPGDNGSDTDNADSSSFRSALADNTQADRLHFHGEFRALARYVRANKDDDKRTSDVLEVFDAITETSADEDFDDAFEAEMESRKLDENQRLSDIGDDLADVFDAIAEAAK